LWAWQPGELSSVGNAAGEPVVLSFWSAVLCKQGERRWLSIDTRRRTTSISIRRSRTGIDGSSLLFLLERMLDGRGGYFRILLREDWSQRVKYGQVLFKVGRRPNHIGSRWVVAGGVPRRGTGDPPNRVLESTARY